MTNQPPQCPPGQVWNPQTRKCEKRVDPDRDLDIESELDTQTDPSSSGEERLQDNHPSAAETTEEQKCPEGQVWNRRTRKCEKPVDPDRDPDLAFELNTQPDLSSSEEERPQDNQPRVAEATKKQECPPGKIWDDSTRTCVDDPQDQVPYI